MRPVLVMVWDRRDSLQSTQQAAQALQTYYSASPMRASSPHIHSIEAQDRLLAALEVHLSPGQQQQKGRSYDGSKDLTKALGSSSLCFQQICEHSR